MTPQAILKQLAARGVNLTRHGDTLTATPKAALTDELRDLIRAHKGELLEVVSKVEPSPEDKDFFRSVLFDARIARYAGADAEERKAKVLAQFAEYPDIKRAMALSPDGSVTVGVMVDGRVWTQDLRIPPEKFDPFLVLERFEKATVQ